MTDFSKRVAVIGAGIAGAACAQALSQAGCHVTLFDKSRGVSGRLSTRRTEIAHYDHGAQYFTVQNPPFRAQVENWHRRGIVAQWQPRVANPDTQTWFVSTPDMPAIVRDLVKDLNLKIHCKIQHLQRSNNQWTLTSDQGEQFDSFTDVVLAIPPAQAIPLIQDLAPSMAAVLQTIDMQPCWTVMVTTSDPVTTALPIDAERVVGHPTLIWWARNDSKPGRVQRAGQADWVIQATAQWSITQLQTDAADVARLVCDAFWRHVGVMSEPKVEQLMAHRWLYSRRHLEPQSTQPSLWTANLGLGVCGDGLIHSRVESAYESGLAMAQNVLAG